MSLDWDDSRCEELAYFGLLLSEVASLNKGSHVIERMQRCIEIAERLDRADIRIPRASFNQFLRGLAVEERSASQQGSND